MFVIIMISEIKNNRTHIIVFDIKTFRSVVAGKELLIRSFSGGKSTFSKIYMIGESNPGTSGWDIFLKFQN